MMFRCSTIWVLAGLACLLIPTAHASAQTQDLNPTDDNNVLRSQATTIQPNGTSFAVKVAATSQSNARIGYLKFDLTNIPSIADPVRFTAITSGAAGADFTMRLYGLNSGATGFDWTEDTITYANRPAYNDTINPLVDTTSATLLGNSATITNGSPTGTTASITFSGLESFRQADNTATFIFLASSQSSATPSLSFNSSEATSGQPTLTVTVPEPGTTAMVVLGMGGLLIRRRRSWGF